MNDFEIGAYTFFSFSVDGDSQPPIVPGIRAEMQTRPGVTGAALVKLGIGASEQFDIIAERSTASLAAAQGLLANYLTLVNVGDVRLEWNSIDFDLMSRPDGGTGYRFIVRGVVMLENRLVQAANEPISGHGSAGWMRTRWTMQAVPLLV